MARKKRVLFQVLHSKFTKNGCDWVITGYPEGARVRLWFKTEKLANNAANERNAEITATGTQDQLPYALRIMALEGQRKLKPYNKTIDDAVAFLIKHLEATNKSVTVRALVDEYLAVQKSRNKSAVHQTDLRGRYERFCVAFGDRLVHEITPKEIEKWLFCLEVAPVTFNNYRERIGFLFGYDSVTYDYSEYPKDTPLSVIKTRRWDCERNKVDRSIESDPTMSQNRPPPPRWDKQKGENERLHPGFLVRMRDYCLPSFTGPALILMSDFKTLKTADL